MRTVIVTGGCGFIGSHFVRLLVHKTSHRIVTLDNLTYAGDRSRLHDVAEGDRYCMVKGDIADSPFVDELFQKERPWAVVNFAAESHVDRSILDPSVFLHTNILGAGVLLQAAHRCAVERFVQISTDEVYGDAEEKEGFTEDSSLNPSSPYAASKAAPDLLCLAYRRTYGLPALIVRSSNNYGPFQFPEKLIPLMIRNALSGEDLPVYGDGLQRRDWLYVEDNCRAILDVLEQGTPGSIYNVAGSEERTNLEVVRQLCGILADETRLDPQILLNRIRAVQDRPGHDRRYALSSEKIRREIGWRPSTSFASGLSTTVRWYLNHRDWNMQTASTEYQSYYQAVYAHGWKQSVS